MVLEIVNVIGKKDNQTSISDADREISTLESTDNARKSVNLDFGLSVYPRVGISVCIGDR